MTEGIEYFKKLSIRREKAIKRYSGLTALMTLIGIMGVFVLIIYLGVLKLSFFYLFIYMVFLAPLISLLLYDMITVENCHHVNLNKKICKWGLKLVSLKLPEDSEYQVFHTRNGDIYLLTDLETNEDDIKIPNNAEKIVISNFDSKYLFAFQK